MHLQVPGIYTSGALGGLIVSQPLGLTQGQFALAPITVAVVAFVATTWIERRVNRDSSRLLFPLRVRRYPAIGVQRSALC